MLKISPLPVISGKGLSTLVRKENLPAMVDCFGWEVFLKIDLV